MSPPDRSAGSPHGGRHLLLATVEDPHDPRSWSGIPFALRRALQDQVDKLTVLRPSRPTRDPIGVMRRLLLQQPLWMTEATLRRNARETAAAIAQSGAHAVLSISSQCIARLDPFPVPTFLFSDAPWLAWKQTYAEYEPMPARGLAFGRLEALAARRCSGLFFGSTWAIREAGQLYFDGHPTPRQRATLHEAQLGANWTPEVPLADLRAAIRARSRDHLNLLFVGRDWERKGGPLAIEVVQQLRIRGVNACLHLVGSEPALPPALLEGDYPAVRIYGALYQNVPAERHQLHELFVHSHLLLVPTRAECFGIIFAEAQSFGLPPVSRNVQALPSVVLDGTTGLLLPPEAPPALYADRIQDLMGNWEGYLTMTEDAIARAATVTDWNQTARTIAATIFGAS